MFILVSVKILLHGGLVGEGSFSLMDDG